MLGSEVAGTHFPIEIRQARHVRDRPQQGGEHAVIPRARFNVESHAAEG